jgi:hypothetical protein
MSSAAFSLLMKKVSFYCIAGQDSLVGKDGNAFYFDISIMLALIINLGNDIGNSVFGLAVLTRELYH